MPIQILPPQLANQIAAGEVVERPASVVKELVENALDAGADKIDIEIERGGHKRIVIRDNGKGIEKDELSLALSRHATSKISTLDDLEAIHSLGFRGEALASISSVSRLTLTSKPAQQPEAWAAIAEGLDMAVSVKPAAHPNGTTIEVLDLFFNTPARRKFLRADKTEFNHIEALIRRISLSRPDASFTLKHNGKVVKRYRGQPTEAPWQTQMAHRLGEVINRQFVEQSQFATLTYDDITIAVWIKQPELCVAVNPAQYAFVNGRMMRDKLLQHAIRQGYGDTLHSEQQPEYVVTVELPATEVDVNVHPAKHEVRFHQSRLVHDLLVRVIQDALAAFYQPIAQSQTLFESDTVSASDIDLNDTSAERAPLIESRVPEPVKGERGEEPASIFTPKQQSAEAYQIAEQTTEIQRTGLTSRSQGHGQAHRSNYHSVMVSNQQRRAFNDFASAVDDVVTSTSARSERPAELLKAKQSQDHGGQVEPERLAAQPSEPLICAIDANRYVFYRWQQAMYIVDAFALLPEEDETHAVAELNLNPAPLLVPVRLKVAEAELEWIKQHEVLLQECGFELKLHGHFVIIKQVPSALRSKDSGQTIPKMLEAMMTITDFDKRGLISILTNKPKVIDEQQVLTLFVQANEDNLFVTKVVNKSKRLSGKELLSGLDTKQVK